MKTFLTLLLLASLIGPARAAVLTLQHLNPSQFQTNLPIVNYQAVWTNELGTIHPAQANTEVTLTNLNLYETFVLPAKVRLLTLGTNELDVSTNTAWLLHSPTNDATQVILSLSAGKFQGQLLFITSQNSSNSFTLPDLSEQFDTPGAYVDLQGDWIGTTNRGLILQYSAPDWIEMDRADPGSTNGPFAGTTINPTDNFIPVRQNATAFADSILSQSGGTITLEGLSTSSELFGIKEHDANQQGYFDLVAATNQADVISRTIHLGLDNDIILHSDQTGAYIQGTVAAAIRMLLNPGVADSSSAVAYDFGSGILADPDALLVRVSNNTNVMFTLNANSGYTGTGTNFLSDDGTYKAGTGGGSPLWASSGGNLFPSPAVDIIELEANVATLINSSAQFDKEKFGGQLDVPPDGAWNVPIYFVATSTNTANEFFSGIARFNLEGTGAVGVLDSEGLAVNHNLFTALDSAPFNQAVELGDAAYALVGRITWSSPSSDISTNGQAAGVFGSVSSGASIGYGVVGNASASLTNQQAIGVAGVAFGNTTGVIPLTAVGLYGEVNSLGIQGDARSYTNAVLLLDNRTSNVPLIIARTNNGAAAQFSVGPTGNGFFAGTLSIGSLTNTLLSSGENLVYTNAAAAPSLVVQSGANTANYGLNAGGNAFITSSGLIYLGKTMATLGFQPQAAATYDIGGSATGAQYRHLFLGPASNISWNGSTNTVFDTSGAGSPEGVVTGAPGSIYRDILNGDIYKKASGTGNTGWSALAAGSGTTINPTDGYLPYRSSSTAFGDSPWYRINTNGVGFNSTNFFVRVPGSGADNNFFIGRDAGVPSPSGLNNIGLGGSTLNALTTGDQNVGLGVTALGAVTSGGQNVGLGTSALFSMTTATDNTAVGHYALNLTTGSFNTASGASAGITNSTGNNNVFLGYNANAQSGTDTNTIAIGSRVVGQGSGTAQIGTNGITVLYLNGTVGWFRGNGTPEGAVTAPIGSFYSREDGGTDTAMYRKESGTGNTGWVAMAGGGGSGDVVGPASSTDNAIVRFDGTTGKLVQNSAASIDDTTGALTLGDASQATTALTANLSGATDPVLTFANNSVANSVQWYGPDGSAAAPTFAFTSQTNSGMYVGSKLFFAKSGVVGLEISPGGTTILTGASLVNLTGAQIGINGSDLVLVRNAAAELQLGADSATATDQLVKGPDGSGTDKIGGAFKTAGGKGTGAVPGGAWVAQTSITNATGSTLQTLGNGIYIWSSDAALTESSATGVFTVALPASKYIGIDVHAVTHADDNTDFTATTDTFNVTAIAKGTAISSNVSALSTSTIGSAASTLTTAWTVTDNGDNTFTLKNNAVASLTQVRLKTKWQVRICSDAPAAITPL